MVLFGKPFGNGMDVPDLSDEEMREWQYQNGEMFLARLPLWKRVAPRIGEQEAADILTAARTPHQLAEQFDAWRRGEPLPFPVAKRALARGGEAA